MYDVARRFYHRIKGPAKKIMRNIAGPMAKVAGYSKMAPLIGAGTRLLLPRRVGRTYYGRYSGKIGPRRLRRPRRRVRKLAKKFAGVNFNFERTVLATDDKCVYIQHCNLPLLNILKYVIYTMFKNTVNAAGIQFSSFNDQRVARIATGDQFTVTWKQSITAAPVQTGYTVLAGDATYESIASGLWASLLTTLVNSATGFTPQAMFQTVEWTNAAGQIQGQLNLYGATVDIVTKSSLKMQNRSVAASGDDEQDVNNVPLNGKVYEGNGNGLVAREPNTILAPTDLTYGWMAVGAGTQLDLQEPPQAYHFTYARGVKKCSIEPGMIKTSILSGKKIFNLNTLFRTLNALYINAVDTNQFHTFGKCRLFAMERVIAKFGAEISPAISIAAEHDFKCWIVLKTKKGQYTGPLNQVL